MTAPETMGRLRISLGAAEDGLQAVCGQPLPEITVALFDFQTGAPVPDCNVDFICKPAGVLDREDDGWRTDARGIAKARFVAARPGEFVIQCIGSGAIDGGRYGASASITGAVEPAPDAFDRMMDESLGLVSRADQPDASAEPYGTPEMRASVISHVDEPYEPPRHQGWLVGTVAALALLSVGVMYGSLRGDLFQGAEHRVCKATQIIGNKVRFRCD